MTNGPGYGGTGSGGARYGGHGYGHSPYGPVGYGGPAGARAYMLASDHDRDRVADLLKNAFIEGRLDKDGYEARLQRALSATTYADLDACMADLIPLPAPVPVLGTTNKLAIFSLVCGIGQMMLWPFITIPAIVLGHVARHQIRRTGESGAGMALAGLILGWVGAGFLALGILAIVLLMASNV